MKQTAVEWLYDEIKHIIPNVFLGKFEKAKEMEKNLYICSECKSKKNDDKTMQQMQD